MLGGGRPQSNARTPIQRRPTADKENDASGFHSSTHGIDAGLTSVTAQLEPLNSRETDFRLSGEIVRGPPEQGASGAAYLRRKISHVMRIVSKTA
jgi:hypothetical protein